VAVTLLLIITVIISMVFQQAGGSWAAGSALTKSESAIRGVLGSVERDLLNAVDARDYGYPVAIPSASASAISFVALQHLYNHKEPRKSRRTPCLIEYAFTNEVVDRAMTPLRFVSEGKWEKDKGSTNATVSFINGGLPLTDVKFTTVRPSPDPDFASLPLRVDVEAEAPRSITLFTISARSSGKNREFEEWDDKTSDDIRVGGKL